MTPSNTPKIARLSDASSTYLHVALPTILEQFGEAEGSPLLNVAATPPTIDAVISSGARSKGVEVPSKENGVWLSIMFLVIFDNFRGIGETFIMLRV